MAIINSGHFLLMDIAKAFTQGSTSGEKHT